MNFDWTIEDKELKKKLTGLFDPAALAEVDLLEEADLPELRTATLRLLDRLAETGYTTLAVGPAARGQTLTLTGAQEELAKTSGSLYLAVESSVRLFGGLIAGWGGPALAREILEPIQAGRRIGALALTEPGGDAPGEDWLTKADKAGDDYVLSGRKNFVTNGPIADWVAVAGAVAGRPAFFILKPGDPGLKPGPRLKTLGYRGLAVGALELRQVKVPAERVIGPFQDSEALIYPRMVQDLILCALSLGVIDRVHNAANVHARTHHRGAKPIYNHQEVRFKLADSFTLRQTAQLLIYRAAWCFAVEDKEAAALIHTAKVFSAEAAEKIAALGLQILAGQGYITGNVVERGYREAKYAGLAGTTSEVSRMNIADDLLRRNPI
ncbi:MAG: acyl-CoA dehydrogenase [Thermodesulfobacteriota bacterium]